MKTFFIILIFVLYIIFGLMSVSSISDSLWLHVKWYKNLSKTIQNIIKFIMLVFWPIVGLLYIMIWFVISIFFLIIDLIEEVFDIHFYL